MKVSEVMTHEVRSIHPQRGLPEAALVMRKYDLGCLPVTQAKKLVGIVTDRDLALRAIGEGRDLATSLIDDVMTSGHTAGEFAKALHRAGVEIVEVWVCGRAAPFQ